MILSKNKIKTTKQIETGVDITTRFISHKRRGGGNLLSVTEFLEEGSTKQGSLVNQKGRGRTSVTD